MHVPLRVLQLGPLYSPHTRRWSQLAKKTGCKVYAAGHVSPGRRRVDLSGVVDAVEVMPEPLYELEPEAHVSWLRSCLDRLQPDVVHAHYLMRWPYVASLAERRPLVATPWGSDLYLATGEGRRRADQALRYADVVIARSPHMQRELIVRGVPEERIQPADLGVDLDRFRPPLERAAEGPPVILSFRAGTELYNLDLVVDAFRIVRQRLPEATLVLAHGEAPLAESVESRLDEPAEAGVVQIPGRLPHSEMADHMRSATVGVSVPSSDGSPNSVWEALATGLPLVLSKLPQIEERVGSDGGAVFVEPRVEAIAAALVELLEDAARCRRMAAAARAWAESNVDERQQVARLGAVYARACSPR